MAFKIAVCIKQVPDTSDIKWTEHNTIQREGLDSVINPYDLGAIQLAKNVKFVLNKSGKESEIIVVTMGPIQAKDALRTAIAMGADKAVLLSDKKFSGADTLATAYTISQFIKTKISDYNLIICGQQAVDGDTAQTPSSLAQKLGIGQITNAIALKEANETYSVWIRDTASCKQEVKTGYPALVAAVLKDINIIPDINGYIKAQDSNIEVLCAQDIEAELSQIGLNGSPTQVKKAFKPNITRNTLSITNRPIKDCVDYIFEEINKCRKTND